MRSTTKALLSSRVRLRDKWVGLDGEAVRVSLLQALVNEETRVFPVFALRVPVLNRRLRGCECAPSIRAMKTLLLRSLIALTIMITSNPNTQAQTPKEKGEAFLKENATKEGVKTLPSGMQYKVITEGTGKQPTATDKVLCHYKGTLINGKEFDSSYSRNEPAEFPVNRVIKGWTEALQLMKEGSKWMLYIPSSLAYGSSGAGGIIGPDETLVFEVELLKVQ